ncbi:MAG: phospholipid carrier-dependent glycosyltransferase [Oscillospiraceae bacterium]
MNYVAFVADIAMLAAVAFVCGKICGADNRKTAAVLYMFNPLPVISIVCGNISYIAAVFACTAAIMAFAFFFKNKHRDISLQIFLSEYILLTAGVYFALFDRKCLSHSITELFSAEKFPIFTVVGIVLAVTACVLFIIKLIRVNKGMETVVVGKASEETHEPLVQESFGRKNILHIIILTAAYSVIVFFHLGNFEAPQTYAKFSQNGEKEIVIDLGEYVDISKVEIFLGYKSKAEIALSTFNEVEREWIPVEQDITLEAPFDWNEVKMSWKLRYIGIVFTKTEEYFINEIVVVDKENNVLTPVNASKYPELFDEQDMYPKYTTYYYRSMFDEVYHARTAYEFINDLPIYENTHPPLGKTLISLGIKAFGMTPFGWRFVCALCGVLIVPIMYLFAWKLSRRSDIAFLGAALFCTEFMHLTLSRIATLDIIIALFILMMFFFMYCFTEEVKSGGTFKKQCLWLMLCGISTALAVATKWTGVYAAVGIAILFFIAIGERCVNNGGFKKNIPYLLKLFGVCVVSFILLPAAVYSLSYIQFSEVYTDKNFIEHAISNSVSMLNYHSGVKADHPYESEWYEWLIDRRSLLDAITVIPGEREGISSVATFGNPIILICGLAAFLHNIWLWRCKGCQKARFLVIAYLSMLMPWLFIHRTVFIYQYFGCIMIIVLILCNSVMNLKKPRRSGLILLCSSIVLFIMFYPVISGFETDRSYVKLWLEWLPTWTFE